MSDNQVTHPVVKRVSLAGLSEGWDDTCYAYVIPATYQDQKELAALDFTNKSPEEQVDYQLKFVADHFISGKIKAFNGTDFVDVNMHPSVTAGSVDVTDHLYAAIMGLELDPKDIRKAAAQNALQSNEPTPTETPSSET